MPKDSLAGLPAAEVDKLYAAMPALRPYAHWFGHPLKSYTLPKTTSETKGA
jgi:hypothetical protein